MVESTLLSYPCSARRAICPKEVSESMVKYESIFIVSTLLEEDKIQEIIEKVKSFVESSAQLEKVDDWEKDG